MEIKIVKAMAGFLLVLTGCSSPLTPPSVVIPSPIPSLTAALPSPSVTPDTQVPEPTASPTHIPITPTPAPTPTLLPLAPQASPTAEAPAPILWNKDFFVREVEGYYPCGAWSPVKDEIALYQTEQETEETTLVKLAGPAFEPQKLSPAVLDGCRILWKQDGQQIFYASPTSNSLGQRLGPDFSSLWVSDRDGNNVHEFSDDASGRYPMLEGWFGPNLLIYSDYMGGGSRRVTTWNISTENKAGEVLDIVGGFYGFFYQSTDDYIAGRMSSLNYYLVFG